MAHKKRSLTLNNAYDIYSVTKSSSAVLLEELPSPSSFSPRIARVGKGVTICLPSTFFSFFFSLNNYRLVFFIVNISTSILIFLICNFCSWSFIIFFLFLTYSFNSNFLYIFFNLIFILLIFILLLYISFLNFE
jgi:hypothetical protein